MNPLALLSMAALLPPPPPPLPPPLPPPPPELPLPPAPGSQGLRHDPGLQLATATRILEAARADHAASATTAAPSPLSQWRVRANASSSNVIDVTFFKPGSLPTRPLLPGESPSRPGDSDITERFLRCRDSEPAATATAFRITWGTFDGRLAPFPSEVVAHIVDHIDGTCGSSSISWSPSRFVEPRRVTSASTASGTSPLLHTVHDNQLTVSNDGAISAAVLAYLLSYVSTVSCCEGVSSMRKENEQYFEPADGSFGQPRNRFGFPLPFSLLPDSFYVADHKFHAAVMEPLLTLDAELAVSTIRHVNCTMFIECPSRQSGALQCQSCVAFQRNTLSPTLLRNAKEWRDMQANPGTPLPIRGPRLSLSSTGKHVRGNHLKNLVLTQHMRNGRGPVRDAGPMNPAAYSSFLRSDGSRSFRSRIQHCVQHFVAIWVLVFFFLLFRT